MLLTIACLRLGLALVTQFAILRFGRMPERTWVLCEERPISAVATPVPYVALRTPPVFDCHLPNSLHPLLAVRVSGSVPALGNRQYFTLSTHCPFLRLTWASYWIPFGRAWANFTGPITGSLTRCLQSYRSYATPDAALNDPVPVLRFFLERGGPAGRPGTRRFRRAIPKSMRAPS